ncbi:sporulation integral membrane protein YlbJ [Paenibacillus cellulosilyticus]|uniref:Sporulation integral membrane protein YlbJ n=1 Tax=Paenibacillus cellulosilyticus TaxID=375489 RepID=A0A2V2YXI6_9BACL|nr:nucleoside recognition protein [Paenibacillus cellulosilyticus]PWW06353.1 sporulation integral membrane protein YlbJ [Paenibacillus cellulosilyticus]QKS46298.1 nucleoside recognition protein [Paenibacillus cellulosilyticus]
MRRTIVLAIVSILLVAAVIRQPDATFQASLQGLTLWWTIVFPGLMPFLVLFELMVAFGVTTLAGHLMEPLTRRLLRLPGSAGLAIAAGWSGGYAAGSEATALLRRNGDVTRSEGQRLLALAHMPNPLFIIIVVGVGFMKQPAYGFLALIAIWTSSMIPAIAGGIKQRLSPGRSRETALSSGEKPNSDQRNLLTKATTAMQEAHNRDGRSFGQALGDATISAVQKLLAAGGIIIICAVLVRLLEPLWDAASLLLHLPHWVLAALLESHLGAYSVSSSFGGSISAAIPVAATAAALSWSGLGAIAQTSAAIQGTDLRLLPFIAARAVHALLAAALVFLLWRPFTSLIKQHAGALSAAHFDNTSLLPDNADRWINDVLIHTSDLSTLWHYIPAALLAFAIVVLLAAVLSLPLRIKLKR